MPVDRLSADPSYDASLHDASLHAGPRAGPARAARDVPRDRVAERGAEDGVEGGVEAGPRGGVQDVVDGAAERTLERDADRGELPDAPLGALLVAMRSPAEAVREAAWSACYARYYRVVWSRALYVLRSVPWLAEPREAAADVASDVFVGLPHAASAYREEGRAEWWLKQVTVRTALRRREALTGRWASGRGAPGAGRAYVAFDDAADQIVAELDAVEREELWELERRRAALRVSPDAGERRWDAFLDLYVAGYGFAEIGTRLGITEGTARNWLCKIRKYLTRPPSADAPVR